MDGASKSAELFARFTAQNVFNRQVAENINSINTSVRTNATNATLYTRFDPGPFFRPASTA